MDAYTLNRKDLYKLPSSVGSPPIVSKRAHLQRLFFSFSRRKVIEKKTAFSPLVKWISYSMCYWKVQLLSCYTVAYSSQSITVLNMNIIIVRDFEKFLYVVFPRRFSFPSSGFPLTLLVLAEVRT